MKTNDSEKLKKVIVVVIYQISKYQSAQRKLKKRQNIRN